MKKKERKNHFVVCEVSKNFVISLTSFVIGFVVAWVIWAQTTAYIFTIMRP